MMHELLNALEQIYIRQLRMGKRMIYICMPRHYVHYTERVERIFGRDVYWNDRDELRLISSEDVELC